MAMVQAAVTREISVPMNTECRLKNARSSTGTDITIGNVTFNFSNLGSLGCVTVDEMGPGVDHLLATGPGAGGDGVQTNNWWHITGVGTGFNVAINLPYSGADGDSRACKWPGLLGGVWLGLR